MEERYSFGEVEQRIGRLWDKSDYASPSARPQRLFSMFLNPPNASGPMHVGNALMIAIQDVIARYRRAKGEATLWIPSIDHGGYETQVTFERDMESRGEKRDSYSHTQLFERIRSFVADNIETIQRQIQAMGASVDWSHLRYTLDDRALAYVGRMFKKMVSDNLIYRGSYMLNYCPSCATVLADIELKEVETSTSLYFIRFPFQDGEGHLTLTTNRPEFLFATTDVLVHPKDERFAPFIGRSLLNPVSGKEVRIVESARKYDQEKQEPYLSVFSPSSKKYDFEYAIRHGLSSRNLLDWEGLLIERYPGTTPEEARAKEIEYLQEHNCIERIEDASADEALLCKKGHGVRNVIQMTWFLRLDDEKTPLRQPALDAIEKEGLIIQPAWRKKGIVEWIGKMHDWPIARQNVWGIKIPIWYEVSDTALFTVWFRDAEHVRRYGNLKTLIEEGHTLAEITAGLERVYVAEGGRWTLQKEEGKTYLPETDTFDTWFSSGAWGSMVFDDTDANASRFFPSNVLVIGYDLLRLAVAREIVLGVYLKGKLPFRRVYLHALLKSQDGQKMSKSLGNAITLDEYLKKFGADVTRMSLLSYVGSYQDFVLEDARLNTYKTFVERLWQLGRVCDAANAYGIQSYTSTLVSQEDKDVLEKLHTLSRDVSAGIEKYFVAQAQEKLTSFLDELEAFSSAMQAREDVEQALGVFSHVYKEYIALLHPFAPFVTEELHANLCKTGFLLAATRRNVQK